MWSTKNYLSRDLTKKETAFFSAMAILLAATAFMAWKFVQARMLEKQVRATLPEVYSGIRQQREQLVEAVEAYKATFGFYPPDHIINRLPIRVDAVTNWLVYELSGVLYDSTNHTYRLGEMEAADAKFLREFFQCTSFTNCAEDEKALKHFITPPPSRDAPVAQFHDDPDVYVLGSSFSYQQLVPEVAAEINLSPWRYVSSNPTNNPGKFDLWMEVETKESTNIIGNWINAN